MAAILRIVGQRMPAGGGGFAFDMGASRGQAMNVNWVVSGLAACSRG